MAAYSATTIAHWFIYRDRITCENMISEKMTLLKLLKLLYYAEGCYLAFTNGKSLFGEKILAWEHGPVISEVYHSYPDAYNLTLTKKEILDIDKISKEDQEILEEVYEIFGQYTAWGLRNKTHHETPWLEATNNAQRLGAEISRDTMRKYFQEHYLA